MDGLLQVGETWTYTATYTALAGDLDDANTTFNDTIKNSVTATFTGGGQDIIHDAMASTLIANVNIEKLVSKTGTNYVDADSSNPYDLGFENVTVGGSLFFQVLATNTGAVDLKSVTIRDVNGTNGGNVENFLVQNGALTAYGMSHITNLTAGKITGDTGGDFVLGVGETWNILYQENIDQGAHVNTASISDAQGATDSDQAFYMGIQEGPGVRTPGFWGNLGMQFWDGNTMNQTKVGPTFADHELLYAVDPDGPNVNGSVVTSIVLTNQTSTGVVANTMTAGLLIGDYNMDGYTGDNPNTVEIEGPEDTLFISLKDARDLINSSTKLANSDGAVQLGRDVVAI